VKAGGSPPSPLYFGLILFDKMQSEQKALAFYFFSITVWYHWRLFCGGIFLSDGGSAIRRTGYD